uniref:peptidylprolyl isomerase n=1 Tax=Coccolithus braarudii TaxID=221442 RepID=A0A7S0Q688_9EUKA|mmetsp:Transcript_41545/g.88642  ORF Transcript_41545/g.88642 Transcript_41545/m.88642 type:complete len:266 (+) Transcript_41545:1-798(+)
MTRTHAVFLALAIAPASALHLLSGRGPLQLPTKPHPSPIIRVGRTASVPPSSLHLAVSTLALPSAASALTSDEVWRELNRPPIMVSPFEITPIGYIFVGSYLAYVLWQIFGPVSEAEQQAEDLRQAKAAAAGRASIDFLKAAAEADGATVTSSGLVYNELVEGSGGRPSATQSVRVHYEGKLADGTIFDSSYQRGEPISFGLNQVIPGWTEGLQLMKEGGKARLTIPSELAYGPLGSRSIPGNSALQFEVELLALEEEKKKFGLF